MVKVVGAFRISFGTTSHNPMNIVKDILAGAALDEERCAALEHWWKLVDTRGIRDFRSKDVLVARLAICLLSPAEEKASQLGEQLSWFLEVLFFLGLDVDRAVQIMHEHFEFRE